MSDNPRSRGGAPWDAESWEVICCSCGEYYAESPRADCTQGGYHHHPIRPSSWGEPLKPKTTERT